MSICTSNLDCKGLNEYCELAYYRCDSCHILCKYGEATECRNSCEHYLKNKQNKKTQLPEAVTVMSVSSSAMTKALSATTETKSTQRLYIALYVALAVLMLVVLVCAVALVVIRLRKTKQTQLGQNSNDRDVESRSPSEVAGPLLHQGEVCSTINNGQEMKMKSFEMNESGLEIERISASRQTVADSGKPFIPLDGNNRTCRKPGEVNEHRKGDYEGNLYGQADIDDEMLKQKSNTGTNAGHLRETPTEPCINIDTSKGNIKDQPINHIKRPGNHNEGDARHPEGKSNSMQRNSNHKDQEDKDDKTSNFQSKTNERSKGSDERDLIHKRESERKARGVAQKNSITDVERNQQHARTITRKGQHKEDFENDIPTGQVHLTDIKASASPNERTAPIHSPKDTVSNFAVSNKDFSGDEGIGPSPDSTSASGDEVPAVKNDFVKRNTGTSLSHVKRPTYEQRKHIYEHLRKVPWVDGYFSAGDSIEIYADLNTITADWALKELMKQTNQPANLFHIKHTTEQ